MESIPSKLADWNTQITIHTYTYRQFSLYNLHDIGLWRGKPMQTWGEHEKAPARWWIQTFLLQGGYSSSLLLLHHINSVLNDWLIFNKTLDILACNPNLNLHPSGTKSASQASRLPLALIKVNMKD